MTPSPAPRTAIRRLLPRLAFRRGRARRHLSSLSWMFWRWVPHPGPSRCPCFEDITAAWATGWHRAVRSAIAAAVHRPSRLRDSSTYSVRSFWNLRQMQAFRRPTRPMRNCAAPNAETQLLAPAARLAMTVNVASSSGLRSSVPGLLGRRSKTCSRWPWWPSIAIAGLAFARIGPLSRPHPVRRRHTSTFAPPKQQLRPAPPGLRAVDGRRGPLGPPRPPVDHARRRSQAAASCPVAAPVAHLAALYALRLPRSPAFNSMPAPRHGKGNRPHAPDRFVPLLDRVLGIMWLRQSHGLHTNARRPCRGGRHLHDPDEDSSPLQLAFAAPRPFRLLAARACRRAFLTGRRQFPGAPMPSFLPRCGAVA